MKKAICSLALALSLCMSLGVSASAASYVADDINYQNLNGQQQAIMVYTLLPDQQPEDLIEQDFEYDGYLYAYSGMTKQEQTFNEEKLHTETITVNTGSKDLKDILAELKPTIEFDDGTSHGILALDHETIKTEAAGYKTSSYTVTATKNFTGLASNDSSLIDPTAVKNGRTLSLSNITWSVESTALVGDALVPATYSAVATYSGTASSTVATGYITTAEYTGKVTASGTSSIKYTVTYIGTPVLVEEPDTEISAPMAIGGLIVIAVLCGGVLFLILRFRKNTTVYKSTGEDNEYDKCGKLSLKVRNPELRIDHLKDVPSGVIAIEVDEGVAKRLFGKKISVRYYDRIMAHTVGTVNGPYWFKMDVGEAPVEDAEPKEEAV